MNQKAFSRNILYFTAVVAISIWALLAWDYYHGGVQSHHFLAKEEMPAISNWWGGLLLPLLTWFLLYRIKQKNYDPNEEYAKSPDFFRREFRGFIGGLLFGTLLSVLFSLGQTDLAGMLMLGLLMVAFLFPIYRPECLLGFVLSMTYTFGGVLPTIIGLLLCVIGLVLYGYIRPAVLYIVSKGVLMLSLYKQKINS
ncbi:hypothetical protein [Hymenobacter sp. DG25A]|uniref:hypothetical protein n=1 Tax=Hymenobacter sp. DG25A TaxID=1385663 RepID=UPI0006BD1B2C|nr:hypothetical protein [Hymenobacter sp. DG25A]ALD20266.1 hypothetical protein AM218_02250 [Hymenobacter sp. DG25A]